MAVEEFNKKCSSLKGKKSKKTKSPANPDLPLTDEEVKKILAENPDLHQFEYSTEEIFKIVDDMNKILIKQESKG